MTNRLERAIARLHSMNHEEYASFLQKHTKSKDSEVSFAHIDDSLSLNNTYCNSILFNEIITSRWENYISSCIEEIYQEEVFCSRDEPEFDVVFSASNSISPTLDTYKVAA